MSALDVTVLAVLIVTLAPVAASVVWASWRVRRDLDQARRDLESAQDAGARRRQAAELVAAAVREMPPPPAVQVSHFGDRVLDSSRIPDHAQSRPWEACHLFPRFGKRPDRTRFGLQVWEPPVAMVCPECDLRQPVLHPGRARACTYCGAQIMAHGSRVYWWPAIDMPDDNRGRP